MSDAGVHETAIARGALAQQVAQVAGVVAMLVGVTVVGRELSLREFGVYGLVISIGAYLLLVQVSVEGATVRAIAAALDERRRAQVFSTALAIYTVAGLVSGALVAGGGILVIAAVGIGDDLRGVAYEAAVALGVVMALGWPFKVFQDALRGTQRFFAASAAEVAANVAYAAGLVALVVTDAPFWSLVAVGGGLSILIGLASAVTVIALRVPFAFRRSDVHRETAGELIRFGGGLGAISITDVIVYMLDRVILAAFRPASVVGLYEAVVRPHALVRQLHGTLVVTTMPVASGFVASGDEVRLRELIVRGTRYVLGIVVPVVVVLMVLAAPILEVWLGERFREGALAMTIFVGYWLVAGSTGPGMAALTALGKIRLLTVFAWVGALLNLAISLALTPWLGLLGPVIATAAQSILLFPWFLSVLTANAPVSTHDFLRRAWIPSYLTGLAVLAAVLPLRLAFGLDDLGALIGATAAGLGVAAAMWWFVWFDDIERRLVRGLLRRSRA